ncbi:succinyl-diaminopimelate desuccinylase [Hyphococcus flavus]|uniref:Succinyl-diaminopimelate desuccinylase n=1 Tax=Hyphococcus flavus TaxID=1866326 RepID=A0AAE9ZDM3_9PROT|nr:succinyl-diaminopimelate desuccinylase [Hyphococcus flavus]WDI32854.1 succinyl-diaminopimelate desuccinylase [Hyphococcus flavus]
MTKIDPIELSRALIKRPSVTPADEGALDVLEGVLKELGFKTTRLKFAEVDNLYAQFGETAPNLCFAGHTDVVPPGNEAAWASPPFDAEIKDGKLWGRGAADMKSAIAAFAAAASRAIEAGAVKGSLSFLITGDEEGPAINGTKKVLAWLHEQKIRINHCLVGEPSNPEIMGDMIKVGRRGSINCWLKVKGKQGHVAYPHRAQNPIPALLRKLLRLSETPLDDGYERFQPSNLEITDIHIGNPAHNVIPEKATARFNIRFNPNWTGPSIDAWLREQLDALATETGAKYELETIVSGEAFLTTDMNFLSLIADCVEKETDKRPEYSTSGGTSDARFIKDFAPVAEFGMVGATMHQTDEHVGLSDIETLTDIYEAIIAGYFQKFGGVQK